jgi:nicotinate-nucleotide pyrophosphorylase (carboxylating)
MAMDREQLGLLIGRALREDVGQGDLTSTWALLPSAIARGRIVALEHGVLAGLEVAQEAFRLTNALIAFTPQRADGQAIGPGDVLATVVGPAVSVFSAERTALNFLEHMSGIATLTRRYVEAVQGTQAVILGTRKTAPGLREIDHWAVQIGGGGTHHARLDDMVLIRSGHIAIAGGLVAAMERVREVNTGLPIVVEVQDWSSLDEAVPLEPDRLMLTHMSQRDIADAVRWVAGRVAIEVSGEVSLDEVRAIAELGVDYIAVGALTQHAQALRVSLEIDVP